MQENKTLQSKKGRQVFVCPHFVFLITCDIAFI